MFGIMSRYREMKEAMRVKKLVEETRRIIYALQSSEEKVRESKLECRRMEGEYVNRLISMGAKELLDITKREYTEDSLANEAMMKWSAAVKSVELTELKIERLKILYTENMMKLVHIRLEW